MGTISKNFSYLEFEESITATQKGICNTITSFEVMDSVKALVLNVLQPLRDACGKSLKINSGYRCPELNKVVGGVGNSQHTKGEAADVASDNPYELAKMAKELNLPFDQMILYPTFVHFSHKLKGPQRGYIGYNKSYKGKRL